MTSPGVADADLGLVFVSNLQHDRQAQSGAIGLVAQGPVKRFKHAFTLRGGNARSGVLHFQAPAVLRVPTHAGSDWLPPLSFSILLTTYFGISKLTLFARSMKVAAIPFWFAAKDK